MRTLLWIAVSTLILAGSLACGSDEPPGPGDPCDGSNPPPSCLFTPNNDTAENNQPECEPTNGGVELCDGTDNDCDGEIDEDFDLDVPCQAGEGACLNTGMTVCSEDQSDIVCSAIAGDPSNDEICDDNDNDCDGQTDEDFAGDNDQPGLGDLCTMGEGACAAEGVWVCNADGDGLECDATPGEPTDELCDGIDNDCDGQIDEDFTTLGDDCASGLGACEEAGTYICNEAGDDVECDATPGEPSSETCDGIDNDCDGQTDEDFANLGDTCTDGVGACEEAGTYICDANGQSTTCDATPGQPSPELCDGIDNDCDGQTDEEASDINTYYLDCDGDGFAADDAGSRQRCTAPDDSSAGTACGTADATWTTTAPTGSNVDCHSTNPDVFPGQTSWFDTPYDREGQAITSWDYNCDGTTSRRYQNAGVSSTAACSAPPGFTNNCGIPSGWTSATAPFCGNSGDYSTCSPSQCPLLQCSMSCRGSRTTSPRTQECR